MKYCIFLSVHNADKIRKFDDGYLPRIEVTVGRNTVSYRRQRPPDLLSRKAKPSALPHAGRVARERKHPAIHLRRTKYSDPLSWPNANPMQILRRIPTMGRPSDMVMSSHVDPDEHTASPAARTQDCAWCTRVFEIRYTLLLTPTFVLRRNSWYTYYQYRSKGEYVTLINFSL